MMKRVKVIFGIIFIVLFVPTDSYLPIQLAEVLQANENNTNNQEMQVHFINVGQGDSILIETPNGKNVLIDGGPPTAGVKLVNYLKQEGIQSIDMLVSTHPDIDHIGGLINVIKKFKIDEILDSGKLHHTRTYFEYINQINQNKIPVRIAKLNQVDHLDKNISLKVLNNFGLTKSNNQSSLALLLSYKEIDFLLMSDVEVNQEMKMIDSYDLESEILKVAHHGSDTSSSRAFLQEVKPEKAILSYSKSNDYGHPVASTIDKLLDVGATIYSTAKAGDIVITTNGYEYEIDVSGTERVVKVG